MAFDANTVSEVLALRDLLVKELRVSVEAHLGEPATAEDYDYYLMAEDLIHGGWINLNKVC